MKKIILTLVMMLTVVVTVSGKNNVNPRHDKDVDVVVVTHRDGPHKPCHCKKCMKHVKQHLRMKHNKHMKHMKHNKHMKHDKHMTVHSPHGWRR